MHLFWYILLIVGLIGVVYNLWRIIKITKWIKEEDLKSKLIK